MKLLNEMPSVTAVLWVVRVSIREHPWRFAITLTCMVASKVVNLGIPITLKALVDRLQDPSNLLVVPAVIILAHSLLRFVGGGLVHVRDLVFERVLRDAVRRAVIQVYERVYGLSMRFHLNRQTGGITRDIERGKAGIYNVMAYSIFHIGPIMVEIVLVVALMLASFSWVYSAVLLGTVALYVTFTFLMTERRSKLIRQAHDADTATSARAFDALLSIETVKHHAGEVVEIERHDRDLRHADRLALKAEVARNTVGLAQIFIATLGLAIMLAMASSDVAAGRMTLGDLVLINTLLIQVIAPLNFLASAYREIRQGLIDLERMHGLMTEAVEVTDSENAKPLKVSDGVVRFENASFGYTPDRPVLQGITFEVHRGRTLVIVGSTGSGKSTLIRLLSRLFDVSDGTVTIDGQDVRSVTQRSLRRSIGYVPQDPVLFNDTIRHNIAYGNPGMSDESIRQAARVACIHDAIEALAHGYDTMVGERGLKISGGERQRIAIARAILSDPPILVFDEATSSLDLATEAMLNQSLFKYGAAKTKIVVTHRVAAVVQADEIVVLSNGRIAERGSHADLLGLNGVYARLRRQQMSELERKRDPVQMIGGVAS